jgi:peptide-methionine (R)-S-oxide reductase
MTITRRKTLLYAGASVALLSLGGASAAERFEITRSAAEWRRLLSADEYAVLRDEATEKRYTSPLVEEKRAGLYHCKGCELAVYSSEHKYDSGTGWPSFWQALPQAVGTKQDNSFFSTRTEVHCLRCGGHFGHIFDDGPAPTGERHCLNGLALTFKPQEA